MVNSKINNTSNRATSRGSRPGFRRFTAYFLGAAVIASVLGGCVSDASGKSATTTAAKTTKHQDGFVGYPSWLPKKTLNEASDLTLTGTLKSPALTEQGDLVKVVMPKWSVFAKVSGPVVPGEGMPYEGSATTCTWTVTLYGASHPVPINISTFDTVDEIGNTYHPYLVPGQPKPPAMLLPGKKVTFELRTGEDVGEGLMRWAPSKGQIIAKWDFVVEND